MAKQPPRHLLQHLADAGDDAWKRMLGEQLLPEPEEVSLPEFVCGLANSWRVEKRMLAPKVHLLMWFLIDMLNYFFAEDICLVGLTEDNIRVNRWTCKPRLSGIFKKSVLAHAGVAVPPEVANLLHLMRTKAVRRLFLIRFHPSLCPLVNRGAYLVCMCDIVWDGMREIDGLGNGDGYRFVINNLSFDSDWEVLVRENRYLEMYFERGDYQAQGDPTTHLPAGQEVMRFHRDVPVNWIEGVARDDAAPYGLRLRKEQTALMLYSVMPRVAVSMAESLDVLGYLCVAGIEPFFPGHLLKPTQS